MRTHNIQSTNTDEIILELYKALAKETNGCIPPNYVSVPWRAEKPSRKILDFFKLNLRLHTDGVCYYMGQLEKPETTMVGYHSPEDLNSLSTYSKEEVNVRIQEGIRLGYIE